MVLAIIICTITKCSNLMLDRWHLMITTWWQWQSLMMSQETTSLIARQGHCALGHIAAFCTLFVCTNEIDYCSTICTNCTTKSKFYVAQDCGNLLVPGSIVPKVFGCRQTRYTGYSFWDRLRNFLHKFTWIVLSVNKLNKLGKFW